MLKTLRHGDKDKLVVVAKLLIGYITVTKKVADSAAFFNANDTFDANFVAAVTSWQGNHGVKADGVIGKDTWTAIAANAPTCSTSKNKTSGYTLAVQMLVDGNLTCDAIYGSRTKSAVAAFQEACSLKADGICGPKTWKALVGVKEDQEKGKHINPCVHYLQWDKRWKNIKYSTHTSKQTIGNSGCGPTAVAQVVATWVDPAITPVEMCKLALDNGYRTYDSGTKGDFCIFVANKYPEISKCTRTGSVETVKAALKQGALAVCCMNSNDNHFWTSGGHYITAIGYDDKNYIYANDPNKSAAPRKQLKDKFQKCLKQAWILWPTTKAEDIPDPFDGVSDGNDGTPKRGDAIVDISKYQPTVNYDKFIKATELIILRAGYRGTGGGIKEDQKFQLHADELTKRGVRFGVYFYSIAKNKEQAREEARMFWKYANRYKPLFWAMDAEKDSITKDAIVAFIEELRKQGAKKVGCYVANHLYQKYDYASIKDKMDFTWIPSYGKNDGTIQSSKKPKHPCDMWQFTSRGFIEGISQYYTYEDEDGKIIKGVRGVVDMNTITNEGHDLEWFCGGEAR